MSSTDHIFREDENGQLTLIGDFEGLYRSEPDPWQQSGKEGPRAGYYAASRNRLVANVSRLFPAGCTGLEVGCGHGQVTNQLMLSVGGRWTGADISLTAIETARARSKGVSFYPVDITHEPFPFMGSERCRYDVVILSQLLWYVLEKLDATLRNAAALVRPGGVLIVSQAFLHEPQRYGREIADGFDGALSAIRERLPDWSTIVAMLDDTGQHVHKDGIIIMRKPTA